MEMLNYKHDDGWDAMKEMYNELLASKVNPFVLISEPKRVIESIIVDFEKYFEANNISLKEE